MSDEAKPTTVLVQRTKLLEKLRERLQEFEGKRDELWNFWRDNQRRAVQRKISDLREEIKGWENIPWWQSSKKAAEKIKEVQAAIAAWEDSITALNKASSERGYEVGFGWDPYRPSYGGMAEKGRRAFYNNKDAISTLGRSIRLLEISDDEKVPVDHTNNFYAYL